jgi:hypothetical protein
MVATIDGGVANRGGLLNVHGKVPMEGSIEDDVVALIRSSIRSVWALELLLLLRRDRRREWAERELVRELRGSPALVREGISALSAAGLVGAESVNTMVYQPRTLALDEAAGRLARAYEQTPVAVVKAIAAAPDDRIQTFADAFRFKR